MRIFGRNANQQPTKPDIPPELQPYYDGRARRARVIHALGRLLPYAVAVVLAAAIIGGAFWLRNHRVSTNSKPGQGTSQQQGTLQQNDGRQPRTAENNNATNPPAQNNQNATSNSPSASGGTSSGTTSADQSQASNASTAAPGTIPNTGPGEVYLLALGAGLLGAGLNYTRIARSARKQ